DSSRSGDECQQACIPLGLPVNGGYRGCLPCSLRTYCSTASSGANFSELLRERACSQRPFLSTALHSAYFSPSLLFHYLFTGYSMPDFGQNVYRLFSGFLPDNQQHMPISLSKETLGQHFYKIRA